VRFSFKPRPRRAIDLDPLPQRLLLALARREPATFRMLRDEIDAIRPTPPRDALAALLLLEEHGLVARQPPEGMHDGGRRFARTHAGRRLCRAIPHEPRSPATFFL
jgi:hypothetical protein